jgi:hypothetical protein
MRAGIGLLVVAGIVAAFAALVFASASAAGLVIPISGAYSGATAAGEPYSMTVSTRKTGARRRPKRKVSVGGVMAAVPVSCSSGENRSEEVGFPGPLNVGRNGRFGRTGTAASIDGGRVVTKVAGRFTGRRRASGRLSYRGGFSGEFCSGAITWKATRDSDLAPTRFVVTRDDLRSVGTCQLGQLGHRLIAFNRALNEADINALRRFWRVFKGFSIANGSVVGHRERFRATFRRVGSRARKRALQYLRRHEGFRLQLNEAVLWAGAGGVQGIRLEGRWISTDDTAVRVAINGAVSCHTSVIPFVKVTFGDPGDPIPGRDLCPDPPGGAEPGVLVLCVTPR